MTKTWALAAALMAAGAAALAVSPEEIVHTTQADFAQAQREDVIVSSRGQVQLARTFEVKLPAGKGPIVVSAIAVAGDALYVASGSDNTVYKVTRDGVESFAEVPGTIVTALLFTGDKLLAGTGGQSKAGLYRIDPQGAVKTLWSDESVKYVWAVIQDGQDGYYLACGNKAALWHVTGNQAEKVYEVKPELADHFLCLARDKQGLLYAGTDKNGLVFQVAPADKSGRVLLDAEEKEIAALAIDQVGGVFAATSDASRAAAEQQPEPETEKTGRSDKPAPENPDADGKDATDDEAANGDDEPEPRQADQPQPEAEKKSQSATGPSRSTGAAPSGPGNAIYYIHASGMVETVFREKVTILGMIHHERRLLLATGNGGRVLSVQQDGDAYLPLVDTEAKQATCLAVADGGRVVFGTANPGSVGVVQARLADSGTLTSKPIDARQIATWGTARLMTRTPAGTQVKLSTRSGNMAEPDDKTWSPWSEPKQVTAAEFIQLQSPAGRFCQYRLILTGNDGRTPQVERIELIRQVGNLAPTISAVKVSATNKAGSKPAPTQIYRIVEITAADGNQDTLKADIYFRDADGGPWVELASDIAESKYAWDTRNIADGVYELRVVVSDAASNPEALARQAARVSEIVTVDNTGPRVENLAAARAGDGAFTVTGALVDATSRIVSVHYAVDSQEKWQALLPADGVADARGEKVKFTTDALADGAHRISVKGTDVYGNTGYGSVIVQVD